MSAPRPLRIVALGDSLTEGFGVAPGRDYPAILEALIQREGHSCRVINAGRCGDTCRGAAGRLTEALEPRPDLVILAIGLNDILMGAMPERIRSCVSGIVQRISAAGVAAVLAGMVLPPMGDPDTERAFADLYPAVATELGAALLPGFNRPSLELPEGVQFDGLHPTAKGYAAIAARILPGVIGAAGLPSRE